MNGRPQRPLPALSPPAGTLVGEDAAFCCRWRAIGGEVWVDPAIRVRHHGSYTCEADPESLFRPAARAAAA